MFTKSNSCQNSKQKEFSTTEDEQQCTQVNKIKINQQVMKNKLYNNFRQNLYSHNSSFHVYFDSQQQINTQNKQKYYQIAIILMVMTIILSFAVYHKQLIRQFIIDFNIIQIQKHQQRQNQSYEIERIVQSQKLSLQGLGNSQYNQCPHPFNMFHVYYNETDSKMKYLNPLLLKKAKKCQIPIVGFQQLKQLRNMWNKKYSQHRIILSAIKTLEEKQNLLILLKLYFQAGTYLNIKTPYSSISNKCYNYVTTGFNVLYGGFTGLQNNQIRVPDTSKFIKVRFPHLKQLQNMIIRLINGRDMLEDCKNQQCLVIKCYS